MHNHADVAEIAANAPYRNLWQLLGATDHYVWEIMRKCGVPEERIEVVSVGGTAAFEPMSANRNCRIELFMQ